MGTRRIRRLRGLAQGGGESPPSESELTRPGRDPDTDRLCGASAPGAGALGILSMEFRTRRGWNLLGRFPESRRTGSPGLAHGVLVARLFEGVPTVCEILPARES